ncbi:integrase [Herbaspirillum rubrisubalbicans]|uniref:site-specific integrase n=1 Tax=Herbaspirillum TaxID=963 RepID=UPI0009808C64|nr:MULTISPECIES: site-specific integrase [Herbaspirillum]MCP1572494.1 integrase [Herbaspirillum rubrisubalbicans]ONN67073.1 recombinase [Herbaspirillum sp. VT-16-41]
MIQIDDYLRAATRDNTRKSYRAAVNHFEIEWGGFLPATADSIVRYLAAYAGVLAHNTLKQRISALGQWHVDQGFPDPTKVPVVRKMLRGIQELHPAQEKRAKPLQLEALEQTCAWLEQQRERARHQGRFGDLLRHTRDKALLLIGFWRGFRSDELARLEIDRIEAVPGEGMSIHLPRTKTDRSLKGTTYKTPALSKLCPVAAYLDWLAVSRLKSGAVIRGIDRWGTISNGAVNAASIIPLLRRILKAAGVTDVHLYSSHSLRRGFASWASANGWEMRALMEYVGWKNVSSASRYVDSPDPYHREMLERLVPKTLPLPDQS